MTDNHTESPKEQFIEPLGGYGRIWQSMYEGSLAGAGLAVFAVWPYVIANMRRDVEHGAAVNLNPRLLAAKLGGTPEEITAAIGRLCEPDPESHNQAEGGRRLVKVSGMLYRVVNGAAFMAIRHAERKREMHRVAQERYRQNKAEAPARERRQKMLLKSPGTLSERLALQAEREGDEGLKGRVNNLQLAKQRRDEAFARTIQETIAQVQAQESVAPAKESLSENGGGGGGVPPEGAEGERFPEV